MWTVQVGQRVHWRGWIAYVVAIRCGGRRVVIRLVMGEVKTVSINSIE